MTSCGAPPHPTAAVHPQAPAAGPSSCGALPFVSRAELPHYRLYDFAKTALVKIFVTPYASVCDLYCGGGSDTDKWDEAQIGHYIGVDASSSGITDARETWESQRKPYTAEFLDLDPSFEKLVLRLEEKGIPVDVVCCLQHLQLCFDSEERARNLLRNVSNLLKPGGYFFGITPDSSTIWTKYQKNVEASHSKSSSLKPIVPNCIRSENYVITFETEEDKFPLFGKKYHLKFANDITSESHCLVHFPSLTRLAREAGLDYVEIQNLTEFYDDNRAQLASMLYSYGANFVDPRGKLLPRAFDILGLFTTFVFRKPNPNLTAPISTPVSCAELDATGQQREWAANGGWRQQGPPLEEVNAGDLIPESDKGILGPGPPDLRFSEPPPF